MQESLSIITPVRDGQSTVQNQIESLLELVSELSRHIQLILVDDHSVDATPEILEDLRRKYPQIEVIRNPLALGPSRAAESALHRARGDFIFVQPSYDQINFEELVQLWRLRSDDQLVVAHASKQPRTSSQVRRVDTGFVNRLREWSQQLRKPTTSPPSNWNGLHMMKRSGVNHLAAIQDAPDAVEVSHQSHRRLSSPNLARVAPTRVRP
ncbi:MAG: glycosyltransferase [Pirellula sp.]|nr:glycosyltransferase [Pirellula sp.]